MFEIAVKLLDPTIGLPVRAHADDAGVDLQSTEDAVIEPGHRQLIHTGIAMAIPAGYVGLVHPRSGLAAREGLSIVNTPGTIDAGYRSEIMVCLINTDSTTPITIHRGDRIAQLLIQRVELPTFVAVEELDETARGTGGYGSTGVVGAPHSEVSNE